VDQGQFSGPDFISTTHQRVNVQFADEFVNFLIPTPLSRGSLYILLTCKSVRLGFFIREDKQLPRVRVNSKFVDFLIMSSISV